MGDRGLGHNSFSAEKGRDPSASWRIGTVALRLSSLPSPQKLKVFIAPQCRLKFVGDEGLEPPTFPV